MIGFRTGGSVRNCTAIKFFTLTGTDADPYLEYMVSNSKAAVTLSRHNKCGTHVCVNFTLPSLDFKADLTTRT